MSSLSNQTRILVIDDTPSIHEDYRKVLCPAGSAPASAGVADMEALLFGGTGAAQTPAPASSSSELNYVIDSAMQGKDGVEKLRAALSEGKPYAMAFVDMRMPPGWDGVQTIRELWKLDPALQIVICTAFSDYSPEQISDQLAIDGRILTLRKPFEAVEVRQIARTLCEKWHADRRRLELEKVVEARTADLKRAALTDALTGLPNRALFMDRLNSALLRSRRDAGHKFAVLFIDADQFKVVNDSLGHDAGDQLLLQIANRLKQCAREVDTVSRPNAEGTPESVAGCADREPTMAARLGGDEFTLILENIRTDADAARVAQRLLAASSKPFEINGRIVHSSLSIGITTSSPGYERAEDMLRDADTAMYHAKREGRARITMFDKAMHNEAMARLTFENDLRTAVTQGHIVVVYQPIVDMQSQRLIGFEALARWQHPQRGAISPAEFIPMAEETGAIVALGSQVLEQACRQLRAWQDKFPAMRDLTMSVNVSRKQLCAADLISRVQQVLAETGVNPGNLKLEITESSVMSDTKASLAVLRRIRDMGIQLHIDDFGTGYSSLSCLQNFPLTGLKIDRDFVKEITNKPDQAAIIRTIINLAHTLNIPLVAEGVETAEQTRTLQAMGCDQAQGYLFAKPMEPAAAEKYISENLNPGNAAAA
jgi:predicted signal transduction protein with EAL and GGDEF domain